MIKLPKTQYGSLVNKILTDVMEFHCISKEEHTLPHGTMSVVEAVSAILNVLVATTDKATRESIEKDVELFKESIKEKPSEEGSS